MRFEETKLPGAFVIDLEPRVDARGFFARAWCHREFEEHGLTADLAQANIAFNRFPSTLRGLHYQLAPFEEAKLVRCTRGALYDVIVDLRPASATFLHWIGVELTADNRRMLYVPEGFAHGYQTLMPETEAFYQVTQFYAPDAERGVRWDDPAIGIEWPAASNRLISEKDQAWPYSSDALTSPPAGSVR
jgi:dTDP-4-dehydrorhamnose 3,5-epimerase